MWTGDPSSEPETKHYERGRRHVWREPEVLLDPPILTSIPFQGVRTELVVSTRGAVTLGAGTSRPDLNGHGLASFG